MQLSEGALVVVFVVSHVSLCLDATIKAWRCSPAMAAADRKKLSSIEDIVALLDWRHVGGIRNLVFNNYLRFSRWFRGRVCW